jgi:hypothetical protein
MDLLSELLPASSTSFSTAFRCLRRLHYSGGPPGPITRLTERKGEGVEALRAADGYCGLRNASATCYMNAIVQQLFMHPHVRARLLAAPPLPSTQDRRDSLFHQLRSLTAQLAFSCQGSIRPDAFWYAVKVRQRRDMCAVFCPASTRTPRAAGWLAALVDACNEQGGCL